MMGFSIAFIIIVLLYLSIYSIHFLECIKVCLIFNQHLLFIHHRLLVNTPDHKTHGSFLGTGKKS